MYHQLPNYTGIFNTFHNLIAQAPKGASINLELAYIFEVRHNTILTKLYHYLHIVTLL